MLSKRKCCCTASCTYTFAIGGCGSRALASEPVSVYTSSGGTLLDSGTTDSSGNIDLSWSGSATVWITAGSRFAGQTITGICATSVDVTFTEATGYTCIPCCPRPLSNTLHAMGHTLTRGTSDWNFRTTETLLGMACLGCPGTSSTSVNVTYRIVFSLGAFCSWSFQVQYPFCANCAGHQLATVDVSGTPIGPDPATWPGLASVASGATYFQTTANVCTTLNLSGNLTVGTSTDPHYNDAFTVTE